MNRTSLSEKIISRVQVNSYIYRAHHEENNKINNI